ncbi:MAG: hypothetical protein JSV30_05555 [Candidatus Omnitrophota bacterium]|nr:MAG: hypothetical protein JSV30_05555 [Candidatus Omnitrophota bacterium]
MKVKEKQAAIKLRGQGLTYREIQKKVPVSRSSLSYWLRGIELTPKQLERIKYKNESIKEKFIKYNILKKKEAEKRRSSIIETAKKEINKMSKRDLKLLGTALYWAEGRKASARDGSVGFTNSDAVMIKVIMRWFREICSVPESKFRLSVMTHDPKRIKIVERYWSKITRIPLGQFIAPSFRVSKTSQKKRGNVLPYGILIIRFSNVELFSKILGWIKGLGAPSSSPV